MGAWGLAVADAEVEAVRGAAGHGGAAPAALVGIVAHPPRSSEELRPALGLSQPGAVRLIDRLVDAGWVQKTRGQDGRAVAISATPAGKKVVGRLLARRRAVLEQLLEPLNDDECERLERLLEKLLGRRTDSQSTLNRLCRICDRRSCASCPVAESLARGT
jgi:DNA-binding MarR family transcriptional regulator